MNLFNISNKYYNHNVNDKKITADFKNGVLTVTIPKSEEIKVKNIEIKAA